MSSLLVMRRLSDRAKRRHRSHEPNHPQSYHHLDRSNADMVSRGSFSRLKKAVKRLASRRKQGRPGPNIDGENINPTNTPPGPEPHVVAGDGEGSGADTGGQQPCSMADEPPRPDESESVPAGESEHDQGGGEADVEKRGVNQRYSHLHSDVGVVPGSGPSRGGE